MCVNKYIYIIVYIYTYKYKDVCIHAEKLYSHRKVVCHQPPNGTHHAISWALYGIGGIMPYPRGTSAFTSKSIAQMMTICKHIWGFPQTGALHRSSPLVSLVNRTHHLDHNLGSPGKLNLCLLNINSWCLRMFVPRTKGLV